MNGTGRHSENSGYLVILLLVVALTAFSHSMKELTEIHELSLDASRLVAQWSGNFTPVQNPVTVVKVERVESCESSKQSAPVVELPWLNRTPEPQTVPSAIAPVRPRQTKVQRIERPVITIPSEAEFAGLKRLRRINIDAIRVNPRDREMILKTLNRSINLRIAS